MEQSTKRSIKIMIIGVFIVFLFGCVNTAVQENRDTSYERARSDPITTQDAPGVIRQKSDISYGKTGFDEENCKVPLDQFESDLVLIDYLKDTKMSMLNMTANKRGIEIIGKGEYLWQRDGKTFAIVCYKKDRYAKECCMEGEVWADPKDPMGSIWFREKLTWQQPPRIRGDCSIVGEPWVEELSKRVHNEG